MFRRLILLLISLSCCSYGQYKLSEAIEAYKAGNYEISASILESGIDKGLPAVTEFEYLANSYIALKNYDKAIDALKKALKIYPDNDQFLFTIGQLCTSLKMYDEASGYLIRIKNYSAKKEVRELLYLTYYNQGVELYQKKNNDKAAELFIKCIDIDAAKQNAYSNLISVLYEQKKIKETKMMLEKAAKLFPDEVKFQKNLAALLTETKDYKSVVTLLNKLKKQRPKDADVFLHLVKIYISSYQVGKADTLLLEMLNEFPHNKEVYNEAIKHWNSFNKQDKLRETYNLMRQNFTQEKDIELKIGRTYERENKYVQAKEYYAKIIQNDSLNSKIRFALAALCKKNHEDSSAVVQLKKIIALSNDASAYKMLNEIYLRNKNYPEAIILNKSMGKNNFASYQLGKIYELLNQQDSSEYFIEEAYRLKPGDPFVLKEKAEIGQVKLEKTGAIYYAKEALKKSIQLLEEKQELFKRQVSERTENIFDDNYDTEPSKQEIALIGDNIDQVNIILKTGMDTNEYSALLDKYLSEYPKSIFLLLFKAQEMAAKGRYAEAEEVYRKVIFLNPSLKKAHFGLAGIQQKLQKIDEAIISYKRTLELDKQDNNVYGMLISLYAQQNKLEELCDQWQLMFKNDPDNKVLRERLIEVLHKKGCLEEAKKIINAN